MFWSTFSRDWAISDMRASRAVWKGVVAGWEGRVDDIFSSVSRGVGKEVGKRRTGPRGLGGDGVLG